MVSVVIYLLTLVSLRLTLAQLCMQNPSTYSFKVGDIAGTIISDGPVFYIPNPFAVPDKVIQRAYAREFRDADPISLSQNVAILDVPGIGRVMVDTGSQGDENSPFLREAGRLLENLRAAGISPNSIDVVLLTHGHPDHVSGLTDAKGAKNFPNAKVYIGRREHEFWLDPFAKPNSTDLFDEALAFFGQAYQRGISAYKDELNLLPDNSSPLPGVTFRLAPGHSPGHMFIEIKSGGESLLFVGDIWVSKPDQLKHPKWVFNFETGNRDARRSRVRVMNKAAKQKTLVLAYHEAFPGLGYVTRRKSKYDWIPIPYQLLGRGVATQC